MKLTQNFSRVKADGEFLHNEGMNLPLQGDGSSIEENRQYSQEEIYKLFMKNKTPLSTDYTSLRVAVLKEDVIRKLLQRYGGAYYNLEEVEEINSRIAQELPGKEDLVTEWFLKGASSGDGGIDYLDDYIETAKFFFTHYKEQLFKDVVEEYNEENQDWLFVNPKNLLTFNLDAMNDVVGLYDTEVRAQTANVLPDTLPEGSRLFYSDGRYQIVEAFSTDAVCSLGTGTKWCTKEEEPASRYLKEGPLYIFYRGKRKWAQMTLEGAASVEINDIKNKPFKIDEEMRDALISSGLMGKVLEKVIHSYDPESEFVRFAGKNPGPYMERTCAKHPLLASMYAHFVLGGPFTAGEAAIAQDSYEAMRYIRDVTKRRFLQAEPLIIRSGLIHVYLDLLFSVNPKDALKFRESVKDQMGVSDENYGSYVDSEIS